MLLTVAPRPWAEVLEPLLAECFARNVLWVDRERKAPLNNLSAQDWFDATATSKRLLMFQAFFLDQGHTDLATYNRRFGQPTEAQQSAIVTTCRKILKVSDWNEFLGCMGKGARPAHVVLSVIKAAVERSAKCGYHGSKGKGGLRTGWIARLRALAEQNESIFEAEEVEFRRADEKRRAAKVAEEAPGKAAAEEARVKAEAEAKALEEEARVKAEAEAKAREEEEARTKAAANAKP